MEHLEHSHGAGVGVVYTVATLERCLVQSEEAEHMETYGLAVPTLRVRPA